MSYAGPDLSTYLKRQNCKTALSQKATHILSGGSSALHHLCTIGIVHRDIKPQNLLWSDADNKIVLIDFGMACCVTDVVASPGFGTPCYLPPEAAIRSLRGREADMWAFGVVMLMVLGICDLREMPSWDLKQDEESGFVQHNKWIAKVKGMIKTLPQTPTGNLVRQMLAERASQRIKPASIVESLHEVANGPLPA